MRSYDHENIEKKWQERWEAEGAATASEDSSKPKYYPLVEFPYPSGAGLHTGHVRSYTAMDIIARKRRREGFNVLYPIGWDAFGLPTENYAIKEKKNPREVTKENTDVFRRQLKSLGLSFDWSREVNTTDPAYYRFTQWIFLQMHKAGLAYKATTTINWCPKDKIGLANEEVVDGCCERCGTPVEKREKEQWMLAITKYAKRLYDDLEPLDYIERAKTQQRNWIGPSEGAEIEFPLVDISGQADGTHSVKIFTTRPDTMFGATFLAISPEKAQEWLSVGWKAGEEVAEYVAETLKARMREQYGAEQEKTGVFAGISAINPANKEKIPVWVTNYVLGDVGTGAIMAVPAHDERDYAFAQKFHVEIRQVVSGSAELPFVGSGVLMNSGSFDGLSSEEAKKKITEFVGGEWKTTYKLRDWVFSRQRYWGEPIPMIQCETHGWVPVPESDLPVTLPEVTHYEPTDTGESPLANMADWVNTVCPTCGGPAKRETDVMPNWAGSSWYYLRYCDPTNTEALADRKKLEYWTPVDWYNGGMEHTVLHLLYSRFYHKFLFDIGVVPTVEPYAKRTSHGIILAEDGEKMSKSRGNVVNPDDIVTRFGADTLRVYEMFMGPFEQAISWNTDNIAGPRRFLERVWNLGAKLSEEAPDEEISVLLAETIQGVSDDIEKMKFNTAVSKLMILVNALEKQASVSKAAYETLVLLLAPFAPHLTEELWHELLGKPSTSSIHTETWPAADEAAIGRKPLSIAVQVNGKTRGILIMDANATEDDTRAAAKALPEVGKYLEGKEVIRVVYVSGRLLNFVVS